MSKLTDAITSQLQSVAKDLEAKVGSAEPISVAHNTWQFANITKAELIDYLTELQDICTANEHTEVSEADALALSHFVKRLEHLRQHNVPQIWSNAQYAVPAFLITMDTLRRRLNKAFKQDVARQIATRQKRQLTSLEQQEARLGQLQPRLDDLDQQVTRIEHASETAEQLPETLDNLKRVDGEITKILSTSQKKLAELELNHQQGTSLLGKLRDANAESAEIISKCHTAYSSATSQGLASAFADRSRALHKAMYFWVGGLSMSLLIGGLVGSTQLRSLISLFQLETSPHVIIANMVLAVISVGAPVWFAWLSTRQIGQNFRLAEDYAFKASVSSAYEGYRRETEKFSKSDLPQRLLATALTRLDEEPLRVVSSSTPGSPLHDLLNSDAIKKAAESIPGFTKDMIEHAQDSLKTFVTGSPGKGKKEPTTGE